MLSVPIANDLHAGLCGSWRTPNLVRRFEARITCPVPRRDLHPTPGIERDWQLRHTTEDKKQKTASREAEHGSWRSTTVTVLGSRKASTNTL